MMSSDTPCSFSVVTHYLSLSVGTLPMHRAGAGLCDVIGTCGQPARSQETQGPVCTVRRGLIHPLQRTLLSGLWWARELSALGGLPWAVGVLTCVLQRSCTGHVTALRFPGASARATHVSTMTV